jgi:hypothetical protein
MAWEVQLHDINKTTKMLQLNNSETYEEIFIRLSKSLKKSVGGSYTWYSGPGDINDFSIKIENHPDEDDIHTECMSFRRVFPVETIEEIMGYLDEIVAAAPKEANANKPANKKNGQNAGKRRTVKYRRSY